MLSVIVYGRNDNHGYNMHKRIAISLNAIAEVLTHENDEILYVDYNTSNDLPTVIEAIQDTLTEKAKKLTRIFRVRPYIHDRFIDKTHAQVNEPLARNIAVRRSNPKNKWILSTNTDMVFTPLHNQSLSDIVAKAKDGFYELARFEVPEPLWESLDRKDPKQIISKIYEWGKSLHLNEVVYGNDTILYDAPGDFQLILRDDIFKIDGFDEKMIWGWHVDSNLCKRIKLLRGELGSLQDKLYGYHCNHTRVSGWMHSLRRKKENNTETFINNVIEPYLPDQRKNWGLPEENIEEINIGNDLTSNFVNLLEKVVEKPMDIEYTESYYNLKGYNEMYYSTDHVFSFLSEQLLLLKQGANIVYVGHNQKMLNLIEKFCKNLPNIGKIYYYQYLPQTTPTQNYDLYNQNFKLKTSASFVNYDQINEKEISLMIFDFGVDNEKFSKGSIEILRDLLNFQVMVLRRIASSINKNKIKAININIHNTAYYKTVKKSFSAIQNSYNSRIMVGYTINSGTMIKNTFYREFYLEKITHLIKVIPSELFLFISPFYGFWLGLYGIIAYRAKLFSLKRRNKSNEAKIQKLYKNYKD